MTEIEDKYHGKRPKQDRIGRRQNEFTLFRTVVLQCGYNSSAEAFSAFELYIKRSEGEVLLDEKDIADWDKIRKNFLKIKNSNNVYVEGEECRKCVWSNTESGKIFCTKMCRKKGDKI